jgi:hypothetical protein
MSYIATELKVIMKSKIKEHSAKIDTVKLLIAFQTNNFCASNPEKIKYLVKGKESENQELCIKASEIMDQIKMYNNWSKNVQKCIDGPNSEFIDCCSKEMTSDPDFEQLHNNFANEDLFSTMDSTFSAFFYFS